MDDSTNNTPPLHSYPNADRPLSSETPENQNSQTEQSHPLIHLDQAIEKEHAAESAAGTRRIRTFQSEMANVVKKDNVSLIKIALAEKKRQEKQGVYSGSGEETKKSKLIIVLLICIVAVIVLGVLAYFVFGKNSSVQPTSAPQIPLQSQLIPVESTVAFNVTDKDYSDIGNFIQQQKKVQTELGSVEQVEFVSTNGSSTGDISSQDFLEKMRTRSPDTLARSLDPKFTFGIYSFTPRDSFVLFKVNPNSYDEAYASMLGWEIYMQDDIGGLFINKNTIPVPSQDGATTSTSTINTVSSNQFVDRIVDNKDSRVLLDSNGKIKLLYTFIDKTTLFIGSSEIILKEVLARLTTGRIVR